MDYLKGAPYPGVIKARVTDGRRYTEYILLLENNTVDVYRHVENATRDGSAETTTDALRFQGTPGQGGICLMTHYDVKLYSDQVDEIRNRKIECDRKDIPHMLICIATDYLKGAPYPSTVLAQVSVDRNTTTYMVNLENDTVDVYCRVFRGNRAEMQELPDREESS